MDQTTIISAGRRFDPVQVGMQKGHVCVWAEVEDGYMLNTQYAFDVYGTGWDVPDTSTYVGSVFDGPYVWHVYYKRI